MTFYASKRPTKDSGDGTFAFCVAANPTDLPDELRYAGSRTAFRLVISDADGETSVRTRGSRLTIQDLGQGEVSVAFSVAPNAIPDRILYAQKGTPFLIACTMDSIQADDQAAITSDERRQTQLRLVLLSKEPAFWDWIALHHDPDGLMVTARSQPMLTETIAVDLVLRVIGAHSRSMITRDALVCERAERLIRAYRRTRFRPLDVSIPDDDEPTAG